MYYGRNCPYIQPHLIVTKGLSLIVLQSIHIIFLILYFYFDLTKIISFPSKTSD